MVERAAASISRSVAKSIGAMAAVGWLAVMQLMAVARRSICSIMGVRQNSAMPMPVAFPCVWGVSERTAMRRILGHSSGIAMWSLNLRPTTFVSMPAPLMFL